MYLKSQQVRAKASHFPCGLLCTAQSLFWSMSRPNGRPWQMTRGLLLWRSPFLKVSTTSTNGITIRTILTHILLRLVRIKLANAKHKLTNDSTVLQPAFKLEYVEDKWERSFIERGKDSLKKAVSVLLNVPWLLLTIHISFLIIITVTLPRHPYHLLPFHGRNQTRLPQVQFVLHGCSGQSERKSGLVNLQICLRNWRDIWAPKLSRTLMNRRFSRGGR